MGHCGARDIDLRFTRYVEELGLTMLF